jgi:metal-sulfur cluster biosynthetic enzyme
MSSSQHTTSEDESREDGSFQVERVIATLRTVFDPEIPVNVVDLGLIYACQARPLPEGGHRIEIKMGLTAPGCDMGDLLKSDARSKVETLPGVREVDVELVFEPAWEESMMSDAARLELGML